MPFREKTAWISLVTMLAVFGAYFGAVVTGAIDTHGLAGLHFLILSVVAVIALQFALKAGAAMMSSGDAASPKDERERLIELKATRIAFYVLIAGVLLGVFVMIHVPLLAERPRGPQIGLAVVAAVVLADLVRSAALIAYFRRGG